MKIHYSLLILLVVLFLCSELSAQHVLILKDGSEIPGYWKNDNEFISCTNKTYKLGSGMKVEEDASVNCGHVPNIPVPQGRMASAFKVNTETNSISFTLSSGADYVIKIDMDKSKENAFDEFRKKYLIKLDDEDQLYKIKDEFNAIQFRKDKELKIH
jgi:7-cyano-7-deazaguanine synthase in queuosine biosynthesis